MSTKLRNKKYKREKGNVIGGWKLIEPLGEGGNGDVWEASKDGFSNSAIKILKNIDETNYKRFVAEIHILSSVKIAGVIDIIESNIPTSLQNDLPWFVMPKAVGIYESTNKMSTIQVAEQFVLLAETLAELHEREISHRDIKPENILCYSNRLCFSDFGLVKYPSKEKITPQKRDVGAKFTMAPEMRREAEKANGLFADVYSLAKTLWIIITKQEKGFDGQYNPNSIIAIKNYCQDVYTTSLDNLLSESTDNDIHLRPSAKQFAKRLREWIQLNKDFHSRNLLEWLELQKVIFPLGAPCRTEWTDTDAIIAILNEVSRVKSLNHMFYPTGGGNTLRSVSKAEESGMIVLHVYEKIAEILKPKKLSFESFGLDPQWNYFRLEVESTEATGVENSLNREKISETLCEISPGNYIDYNNWEYNEYQGKELPESARVITRFLEGAFVFFGTRSIYNRTSGTYDARHNKMTEKQFRNYIATNAKSHYEADVT
ncbi:protein kinase [Shewanella sp. SM73]|uniref:protein kinase domain-containing protein n=1 Tax=Shewanella TaxID=22 RepID=UPI0021DA45B4|nr:protein kinase [Shewanella sp. SM73]MCU8030895.1 protein kinase [Shewanella sp. SM73]